MRDASQAAERGVQAVPRLLLAQAARQLGRPVRWIATRTESMLTDNAGRDLIARAEIGFDADLNITAYGVNLVSNLGAYNSQYGQAIQSELFAKVLTGVYDIPVAHLGALGVFTNTTPVDAYRGAGRPEANLTIERVMDHAARVLGVDGFDLRARNVIKTFPYPMISGEAVDCGDFARVLAVAKDRADVAGFAARKAASQAAGRLRGLGVASYLEAILGSPVETSRIVLDADGGLTMYVGTQSNGQGHETVYTRMLAEATGVDPALIRIVQGDSDRIRHGGGTGGSRSVTVQGTATKATVAAVVDGLAVFLAAELGVRDVTFAEHIFAAPGSNMRLTLAEAAELARQHGKSDLLDVSQTIELAAGAYPNGCHVVEVEVDPDTGGLVVERYTVVDDFGTQMAPELVAGQVQLMFDALPAAIGNVKAGKLVALAATGPLRNPALPDVPTMKEQGYPNLEITSWFGIVAPAKTPADILAKLSADIQKAVKSPDAQARFEAAGFTATGTTREEFARIIAADTEVWGKAVRATGFKAD